MTPALSEQIERLKAARARMGHTVASPVVRLRRPAPKPEEKPRPNPAPPETRIPADPPEIDWSQQPYNLARQIVARVAYEHGVSVTDILSPTRVEAVVRARHTAIRRVHEALPAWSCTKLGKFFGRDHTTILFALGRRRKRAPLLDREGA